MGVKVLGVEVLGVDVLKLDVMTLPLAKYILMDRKTATSRQTNLGRAA